MITAARLAGFFAAHAVWCVSDGSPLVPMLAYTTADDERKLERMAHDDPGAAVTYGRERLRENEMDATDAVLLYDGRITMEKGKMDAVLVEMRAWFSPDSEAVLAIPYTPKEAGGFLVHKPKVLTWKNCDDFELKSVVQAFFEGVDEHEEGSKVWNACLDQSK